MIIAGKFKEKIDKDDESDNFFWYIAEEFIEDFEKYKNEGNNHINKLFLKGTLFSKENIKNVRNEIYEELGTYGKLYTLIEIIINEMRELVEQEYESSSENPKPRGMRHTPPKKSLKTEAAKTDGKCVATTGKGVPCKLRAVLDGRCKVHQNKPNAKDTPPKRQSSVKRP